MRIEADVLDVFEAARCEGPRLVLSGQMERSLYNRVAKVIDAAGGIWNRKAGAHLFKGDAADIVDGLLTTGEVINVKQVLGQFDSPAAVVQRVLQAAEIEPGMSVLEPSAGIGRLALAALAREGVIFTIEIDPARAATLALAVAEAHRANPTLASSCAEGMMRDFLTTSPEDIGPFDRIIMNPPFARQADIDHIRHAALFLMPRGRLVSVMSAGVIFRTNRKSEDFRTFLAAHGGFIEPLPEQSFAASGTNIEAVLAVMPGRSA